MDVAAVAPPSPQKKFGTLRKKLVFTARHWVARQGFGSLPDFLIIGAQRSGTTSLHSYLLAHPQIIRALSKEMHYFDYNYHRGFAWYQAFFPIRHHPHFNGLRSRPLLTCDASPYYVFHPHAPRRIAQLLPGAKLILLLRNPVDRAYSHYLLASRKKVETLPFEQAIAREENQIAAEEEKMLQDENYYSFFHHKFSYLSRGVYHKQIRRILNYFDRSRLLVIKSEDLFRDTQPVVQRTLDFLELDAAQYKPHSFPKRAASGSSPEMSRRTREFLIEYFRPHNEELCKLIGEEFSWNT